MYENKELRVANVILKKASTFCPSGDQAPVSQMIAFIEKDSEANGGEPACRVLLIAPSTSYARAAGAGDPVKVLGRSKRYAEALKTTRPSTTDRYRYAKVPLARSGYLVGREQHPMS